MLCVISSFIRSKLQENDRLKRESAKFDQRIKALQDEIDKTRRQRVQLAHQIKERSEAHREWVSQHEHKVKNMLKKQRQDDMTVRAFHSLPLLP
jgi:hypothetical protein